MPIKCSPTFMKYAAVAIFNITLTPWMVIMTPGNIVVNINLIKIPLFCVFKNINTLQICGNLKIIWF